MSKGSSHQTICQYLLIKAQFLTNYHETNMKNYCMITLLKHTRKRTKKQRKKLIEKQRNVLNLSASMRECNVIPAKMHLLHCKFIKANFNNNTKFRLIYPSKSEVGLVSKHYLSSIINAVAEKSGVNKWRNTSTVIKWFGNLQNKQKHRFIKFDIADFYPSIAENLLERSIEYAKSFATIEHKTLEALTLARKSLLFSKHEIWVKKGNSSFDVTMGSFDGAEI